jgi:hypothetical protein
MSFRMFFSGFGALAVLFSTHIASAQSSNFSLECNGNEETTSSGGTSSRKAHSIQITVSPTRGAVSYNDDKWIVASVAEAKISWEAGIKSENQDSSGAAAVSSIETAEIDRRSGRIARTTRVRISLPNFPANSRDHVFTGTCTRLGAPRF